VNEANLPWAFLGPVENFYSGNLNGLILSSVLRQLINVLSALGFSSTYNETALFELSTIMCPDSEIERSGFCQFVFDNADFNINTLDGLGTFHAMGGIQCVTPAKAVAVDVPSKRLRRLPSSDVVEKFGYVSLRTFNKQKDSGLKNISIADVESIHPIANEIHSLNISQSGDIDDDVLDEPNMPRQPGPSKRTKM
jgi:hypothetical protein